MEISRRGPSHGAAAERRRRRPRRPRRARRRDSSRSGLPTAVLPVPAKAARSPQYRQKQLGRHDLTFGIFGENFTVDGLPDDEVCIGDRYRIGEAEFEVTQPRVTCYRVGMRLGEPTMASLLVAHHRPGFYLRVITEGLAQAGDEITLTRKGPGQLSVADTDALLYLPDRDPEMLRKALDIPALSPGWQQSFRELAAAQ